MPQPKQATPRKKDVQGASISPGSPVAAIKAWKEEAMSPKVTDQEWPMATAATATTGAKPMPMSSGATTAMGTPNPATPCRKALNAQARSNNCIVGSTVSRAMP